MKTFKIFTLSNHFTLYFNLNDWGIKIGFSRDLDDEFENIIYLQFLFFMLEFDFTLINIKGDEIECTCVNCGKKRKLIDNKEVVKGFCRNCEHPLWH